MRDYGKIFSTFWSSPTTSTLSDDGKMLALYLMTCGHSTIAGVFRLPDGYVAEDLHWSQARVAKGFAELAANGFASRCDLTKWVWIYKHFKWNQPENPNQRKAALKIALSVPTECRWRRAFLRASADILELKLPAEPNPSGTLAEPLPNPFETVPKPFLNQEQEQEQEQEQKQDLKQEQKQELEQRASRPALATRLAPDWTLPESWALWAMTERSDLDASKVAAKFKDFWCAKAGKAALKLDWQATWRNWVRDEHPAAAIKAGRPVETFKERDARLARDKYAEMTGTGPHSNIIDMVTDLVEANSLRAIK